MDAYDRFLSPSQHRPYDPVHAISAHLGITALDRRLNRVQRYSVPGSCLSSPASHAYAICRTAYLRHQHALDRSLLFDMVVNPSGRLRL